MEDTISKRIGRQTQSYHSRLLFSYCFLIKFSHIDSFKKLILKQ